MTETATLPGLETVDPPMPEGEPTRWIERESQRWPEKDRRSWATSYVSIGPLFLPRAAEVVKPDGCVTLMQSSAVLLNDVGTARQFRVRE